MDISNGHLGGHYARAARGVSFALIQAGQSGREKKKNQAATGRAPVPALQRQRLVLRVERLLGGDEPAKNSKAPNFQRAKGKPRTAPTEHGLDNNKVEATCAVVAGQTGVKSRGPVVSMRPSGCPFDRAHNVRDVRGALKAAAEGGKRLRPIRPAKFHADPRLIPAQMMRTVRIRIGGPLGVELREVDVGPDSQTEYQHEYAARVASETGVNLFGGNLADAVRSVLARGGAEHLIDKAKGVRRSGY